MSAWTSRSLRARRSWTSRAAKTEGGPVDVLSTSFLGGPFEPSRLASTDELRFAGPLRIAA
jgi:hypothetical protein